MSTKNNDLQASQKIIELLEISKLKSEEVLDSFSGIYVVINEKFEILRGNLELGSLLKLDQECLIRASFLDLFNSTHQEIIKSKLEDLKTSDDQSSSFELKVLSGETFIFELSHFDYIRNEEGQLFLLMGKDITELRNSQNKLLEIFSSIPLGIINVGEKNIISDGNSTFASVILGEDSLVGKNIYSILLSHCLSDLKKGEIEAIDNLFNIAGQSELIFEAIGELLPKLVKFVHPVTEEVKYLGILIQPIIEDDVITSYLVILEDKTKIVKMQMEQADVKNVEEQIAKRVVKIKKLEPDLAKMCSKEIDGLFERTINAFNEFEEKSISNHMHGLKGNFRVLGFDDLATSSHEIESELLDCYINRKDADADRIKNLIAELSSSWQEVKELINAFLLKSDDSESTVQRSKVDTELIQNLFKEYTILMNSKEKNYRTELRAERILLTIQYLGHTPVSELESVVNQRVKDVSEKSNKNVEVKFNWDMVKLDEEVLSAFNDTLLHVVCNAVDHGIESEEEREKAGKSLKGTVAINVIDKYGEVYCIVSDDGKGIDVEKLKGKLVEKKILRVSELGNMENKEILQYIFEPNFSTKDEVSQISGRGVGLNAAKEALKRVNGSIHVKSEIGVGTKFFMKFKASTSLDNVTRVCESFFEFNNILNESYSSISSKYEFNTLKFENIIPQKGIGVLFLDTKKIIFSLISIIFNDQARYEHSKAELALVENNLILELKRIKKLDNEISLDAYQKELLPKSLSDKYIKIHNGKVINTEKSMKIVLPVRYFGEQIQTIRISFDKKIPESQVSSKMILIEGFFEELGSNFEIVDPSDQYNILFSPDNVERVVDLYRRKTVFIGVGDEEVKCELLNALTKVF